MKSDKSSYICLACLIVGIALQVLSCIDVWGEEKTIFMMYGVGFLLVILGPLLGRLSKIIHISASRLSSMPATRQWKTIEIEKFDTFYNTQSDTIIHKSLLDWLLTIGTGPLGIILSFSFVLFFLLITPPTLDIVMITQTTLFLVTFGLIRRNIFYILYGTSASKLYSTPQKSVSSIKLTNIKAILNSLNNTDKQPMLFQIQPQLELVLTSNQQPMLNDVRCNLKFNNPIPGLLSSMVCISINNVMGVAYPYAYLVYVFKGEIHSQSLGEPLMQGIRDILASNNDYFSFSSQIQDGNSVYVITKSESTSYAYTTMVNDCYKMNDYSILMNIAKDISEYFDAEQDYLKHIANANI